MCEEGTFTDPPWCSKGAGSRTGIVSSRSMRGNSWWVSFHVFRTNSCLKKSLQESCNEWAPEHNMVYYHNVEARSEIGDEWGSMMSIWNKCFKHRRILNRSLKDDDQRWEMEFVLQNHCMLTTRPLVNRGPPKYPICTSYYCQPQHCTLSLKILDAVRAPVELLSIELRGRDSETERTETVWRSHLIKFSVGFLHTCAGWSPFVNEPSLRNIMSGWRRLGRGPLWCCWGNSCSLFLCEPAE